jgi:hypothetical protein
MGQKSARASIPRFLGTIEVFCHFSLNILGSEYGVADLLKSRSRVVLESYSNDS